MFHVQDIPVVTTPEMFAHLTTRDVVLLDSKTGQINTEQEEALCAFVERGGGLVCIGDAAEAYHEYELLGEVLGNIHGFCTPHCEVIARVATNDHYITRRVDPAFAVLEGIYLLDAIPHDAQVLWRTSWHYTSPTLAYTGFEHGTAISTVPGLEYSLVCDRNEERLAVARQAFPGVHTCTNLQQVADDPAIDVVIVSTPPNTHAAISMQMLRADKHVVTEKPFCLTTSQADEMIQCANEKHLALTVYQCRRWDPDYLAIQQVLKRGTIGTLFHIETFIGGYAHPCDYWHSHEPISGGVFYDWGSHYLDWILQLIPDPVISVRGVEHKRVWHDVTNADHSVVSLRFAGGQEAEFMHSDIAAAMKPKWYILGEQGAIVGHWRQETVKMRRWSGDLIEERLAPSEALPTLTVFTREPGGAIHEQHLVLPEQPLYPFHRNLANHLHNGEPLVVSPQESRRNIAVMETAKRSAERGGETLKIEC